MAEKGKLYSGEVDEEEWLKMVWIRRMPGEAGDESESEQFNMCVRQRDIISDMGEEGRWQVWGKNKGSGERTINE